MKYWLLLFMGLWGTTSLAQIHVEWLQLGEVTFIQEMDLPTGRVVDRPIFDESLQPIEDQSVKITGYILPLDVSGEIYALSRFPYEACFFCGGAGLETVMNVWFAEPDQDFKLDQVVTLQGILRFNRDGNSLIYLLDKAREVEE